MVERLTRQQIAEQAILHEAPVLRAATTVDRSFELPAALFVVTAGCYLGFLATMAVGFGNPHLILPMAIFVTFMVMAFAVPAMWMRMKPDHPQQLKSWSHFSREGVMTAFGRCTAGGATVQVLILPVLILAWGFAVVTIAAVVR